MKPFPMIGWSLAGIAAGAAVIVLAPVLLITIVVVLASAVLLMLALWALGFPITVTVDGEKIGYYKRTKFYPYR